MLKQLHKIFFLCLTLICLTFSNCAFCSELDTKIALNNQINTKSKSQVEELDINPIDTTSVKKDIVPNPKSESKKVLGLFFKTMSGVLISVILLYAILILFKKMRVFTSYQTEEQNDEYEVYDLSTPNNKQDALRSFLNKTK